MVRAMVAEPTSLMTANFASGTVWTGDNLDIMRGMNSSCVDLIYLDPPFNSNRTYEAPIGSKAAGASFKDAWTLADVDVYEHGELADRNPAAHSVIDTARLAHGKGMQFYLVFMAIRLLEMHRLLKPTGSIYLHCDPTASHYFKLLMDGIFGKSVFRNEIVWKRTSINEISLDPHCSKELYLQGAVNWPRTRDVLLHYRVSSSYAGRNSNYLAASFNQPFSPLSKESADNHIVPRRRWSPKQEGRYPGRTDRGLWGQAYRRQVTWN